MVIEHMQEQQVIENTVSTGGTRGLQMMYIAEGIGADLAAQWLMGEKKIFTFNKIAKSLGENVAYEMFFRNFVPSSGSSIFDRVFHAGGKAGTAYVGDWIFAKRRSMGHYFKMAAASEGVLFGFDLMKNTDVFGNLRTQI